MPGRTRGGSWAGRWHAVAPWPHAPMARRRGDSDAAGRLPARTKRSGMATRAGEDGNSGGSARRG
jgi:hypothetical protein